MHVWAQDAYSWPTNSPRTVRRSRIVIRELHPHVEVFEVHPEALDREVARLGPDLVICSRVTSMVEERAANWVELYPECKPFSTFCIGGERRAIEDVQLSDLLWAVR